MKQRILNRPTLPAHEIRLAAHAKVNLTLEVLRRRDDGYHDIRSLMVPLALADRLTLTPGGRRLSIEVPNDRSLEGDGNLALRAARSFQEAFGLPGMKIRLEKRIPVAAGLGGGSSDAAAVLRALGRLRGIEATKLMPLAEALGSDVPFFLKESPALVSGRGERSEPAPAVPQLWLLLVKPDFGISAADAYQAWLPHRGRRFRTRRATWETATTTAQVGRLLRNDLQAGCVGLRPELGSVLERLGALRSAGVLMSGSGSTCFAVFGTKLALDRAARRFESEPGETVLLTRTLGFRIARRRQLK